MVSEDELRETAALIAAGWTDGRAFVPVGMSKQRAIEIALRAEHAPTWQEYDLGVDLARERRLSGNLDRNSSRRHS